MLIVEWAGVIVLVLLLAVGVLVLRRALFIRAGGTIRLSVRTSISVPERGWSNGLGRFVGDDLRWYRIFSFALRPKLTLTRTGLVIVSRRSPAGQEAYSLPADWVILGCARPGRETVEIAMAETTVTGFLSWLESAPPGEVSTRLAAM
ncbi:hypothetical protein J2S43_005903 [Catenuloplanes nepalensis]|uniref:DUF2550 domain-containing protein n=1 Tax=Catenuloplanes nepalensis TaxID=587533 RepID=A0ABT9N290_9ACTN|nr:DUF2550 domain-containing protein [Catenuloplanes nepalensis]MDP9797391.1 hypothetical protein [Catenuloplanes nepalensis]